MKPGGVPLGDWGGGKRNKPKARKETRKNRWQRSNGRVLRENNKGVIPEKSTGPKIWGGDYVGERED